MLSEKLREKILEFRRLRDWEKFHTTRNLATAISIEAAELLEHFRWANEEEVNAIASTNRRQISDEVSDLVILLTYLINDLNLDLEAAVESKLKDNADKYPVETFFGSSKKYSDT